MMRLIQATNDIIMTIAFSDGSEIECSPVNLQATVIISAKCAEVRRHLSVCTRARMHECAQASKQFNAKRKERILAMLMNGTVAAAPSPSPPAAPSSSVNRSRTNGGPSNPIVIEEPTQTDTGGKRRSARVPVSTGEKQNKVLYGLLLLRCSKTRTRRLSQKRSRNARSWQWATKKW